MTRSLSTGREMVRRRFDSCHVHYEYNKIIFNDSGILFITDIYRTKLLIMSKYNGWNNYATFRVHHDILNGYQWDEDEDIYVDLLKAIVENCVFENTGAVGLIVDYANLFLNNVDWDELVEVYNYDRKAEQSS
jgi:hypothetical protein